MENSTSESGIFNSYLMQKINRKCKGCVFNEKLNRNLTKYLFDFLYYRELYQICSANLFLYQCFTEYQLMTWKIEMKNIIDIFHLDIKDEEIDDTLIQCIKKKRTYSMKDHPGNFVRINKDGINLYSIAYYDPLIQKEFFPNNYPGIQKMNNNNINNEPSSPIKEIKKDFKKENSLNFINNNDSPLLDKANNISVINTIESNSEIASNMGSIESINNKNNEISPWEAKLLNDSYNNNKCIFLHKTTSINFGFSFFHVIKGDYQLYLHHSLINMKNERLILKVSINGINIYTMENFPPSEVFEQEKKYEDENHIKLKDYLICSITKKMFEDCSLKMNELEDNSNNEKQNQNKVKDYVVRVTFKNQDLFWKAGWYIDGGRLLRKIYEVNESNVNKNFKRFKSDNISIFGSINKMDEDESKNNSVKRLRNAKRKSFNVKMK